jgi:hypothetical protein
MNLMWLKSVHLRAKTKERVVEPHMQMEQRLVLRIRVHCMVDIDYFHATLVQKMLASSVPPGVPSLVVPSLVVHYD